MHRTQVTNEAEKMHLKILMQNQIFMDLLLIRRFSRNLFRRHRGRNLYDRMLNEFYRSNLGSNQIRGMR
ncbi:conserved hypothetical protein [Culex quinquefasciatus]|uniref:Uncharacterized protein n=1 Tax=Culex quinquefasciatus TaxID=7176 RepID=B0XKF4_CULQU|nr:conserved hypothetical protein [Culex quinquefasciatus]|eukprot:XP_001870126.1 conserved hypothetical protein [Culex quinquefasciatus]